MDQEQVPHEPSSNTSSPSSHGSERTEPVRSRWTPKPEQIHILESIFNSGMVNPPRDETVRIRKLLEKFGSVSDANIFYWFQNRRSRTRRRQRQLKACLLAAGDHQGINSPIIPSAVASTGSASSSSTSPTSSTGYFGSSCLVGASSSGGGRGGDDDLFSMSPHLGLPEIDQNPTVAPVFCPSDPSSTLHYQSGFLSVYINGVPTEVPRGPIDMKAVFGEDAMLVHSSGVPVPVNEYGITLVSLQLGESYFLVSGPS